MKFRFIRENEAGNLVDHTYNEIDVRKVVENFETFMKALPDYRFAEHSKIMLVDVNILKKLEEDARELAKLKGETPPEVPKDAPVKKEE